jgi:outer membrane receptor protein involved in Fe transport
VSGVLTPREALNRLLSGANLHWREVGHGSIVVEAGARGGAADASTAVDELVVTANKREQRLSDVAQAVQAISGEQLYKLGARSFTDYARNVAGLTIVDAGPGQDEIFMRGVAAPQGYIGMESAVGVYLDDVPISQGNSQPDLNLYDIDRVEVLRGPQGTLYGSASMGGTIRLVTNRPRLNTVEGEVGAEGSVTGEGGFNDSLHAILNLPVAEDHVAARFVAYDRRLSGFLDDPLRNLTDVNVEDTYGGRGAVRIEAFDRLTVDLNVLYQHTRLDNPNTAENVNGDYAELNQYQNIDQPFVDRSQIYNATTAYDFDAAKLVTSTSFSDRRRDFTDDLSGLDIFGNGALTPSFQAYRARSFTEEVRLTSSETKPLSWLIGLYYNQRQEDFAQAVDSAGAGALFGLPSDNIGQLSQTTVARQKAVFGEVGYSPVEPFTVTVGARLAEIRQSSTATRTGLLFGAGFTNTDRSTDRVFIPKLNLSYKLNADALVYAQVTKGFRTGGVNVTLQPTADGFVFPTSYGPDSLWNYEVGLRGDFLDRRLRLAAALFYIDWSNIQVDLVHAGYDYFANAGDAVSKGLELEATLRPTAELQLGGQLTLTDAKLSSTTPGVGTRGDRLPYVPRLAASAFVEYGRDMPGLGHAYVRGDIQYVGTAYTGFGSVGNFSFGDYTLVNLKLGIDHDAWRGSIFARNLFDERARLLAGTYYDGVVSAPGIDEITVARPRTIGVELSRSF